MGLLWQEGAEAAGEWCPALKGSVLWPSPASHERCVRDVSRTKRESSQCPCGHTWWPRLKGQRGAGAQRGVTTTMEWKHCLPWMAPKCWEGTWTSCCSIFYGLSRHLLNYFWVSALSRYWRHRVKKTKSLALSFCSQIDSNALCLTSLSLKDSPPNKPNWLSPGHQPSKVRSYKPDTLCWPHQWWTFAGFMCQGSCQAPLCI